MPEYKTIMQDDICTCCVPGCTEHSAWPPHHIIHGTPYNKKFSEREGLMAYLCYAHHQDCHFTNGGYLDRELKEMAQRKYEETHSRSEWMIEVGKNYIMEE